MCQNTKFLNVINILLNLSNQIFNFFNKLLILTIKKNYIVFTRFNSCGLVKVIFLKFVQTQFFNLFKKMFLNKLGNRSHVPNALSRCYTVIVERCINVPLSKKGMDPRKYNLKSAHYQYKFVDCLHNKKWGNIDLILTEYVEGVGHKGEIINVPRHQAYYELLPARSAVYPTEEYLEMYKKDREESSQKAKVSPYAIKTQDELNKMILEIPMNMSVDWQLNTNHILLALRYNVIK